MDEPILTDDIKNMLIDSWHDKKYSHLRTFSLLPDFSTNVEIYDNSSKTISNINNDPQFNVKDVVTHVSHQTYNDPNDFIRLRFTSSQFTMDDVPVDFYSRFGTMVHETGDIFNFAERTDYVMQNFRMNDFEFAKQNDQKQYDIKMREWKIRHNKVNQDRNHPDHPGPPPKYTDPSELTIYDKIMSKSNSTYHLQADDGRILPIKKGNIQWNDSVKFFVIIWICSFNQTHYLPSSITGKNG